MPDVLIIAPSSESPRLSLPAIPAFVQAMQRAISEELENIATNPSLPKTFDSGQVEIWWASDLHQRSPDEIDLGDRLVCPLTLDLPSWLNFERQTIFAACAAIAPLRQQVATWGYATGDGSYWLPIVATAKGVLFGEVIQASDLAAPSYHQPLHLGDADRQPLYALGQTLVRSLKAPPSVYLMQFGLADAKLWFDRLIPFPDAPAIASITAQVPDLFQCHWRCLTGQPVRELMI